MVKARHFYSRRCNIFDILGNLTIVVGVYKKKIFPTELGCAFRFVLRFLTGLIFWNPRNSDSAEHTSELNHSRARLICSREFRREGPVTSATFPYHTYYHSFAICHTIQCCLWCLVRHCRRLRRQPPHATRDIPKRRGRIRNIEFRVLMYSQLAVINSQHRRDFDTVGLKKGPHICKCRSAECMACIWEVKLIRYSGNPGIRGGFTMQNPLFITLLYLSMHIDIHTPLIIPNRVPVDAHYGETINLDLLSSCRPNNCDL